MPEIRTPRQLGPESAAKRTWGKHSWKTADMSASVSVSIPLVALTTRVFGFTLPANFPMTLLTAWLGAADTMTGVPATASRAFP